MVLTTVEQKQLLIDYLQAKKVNIITELNTQLTIARLQALKERVDNNDPGVHYYVDATGHNGGTSPPTDFTKVPKICTSILQTIEHAKKILDGKAAKLTHGDGPLKAYMLFDVVTKVLTQTQKQRSWSTTELLKGTLTLDDTAATIVDACLVMLVHDSLLTTGDTTGSLQNIRKAFLLQNPMVQCELLFEMRQVAINRTTSTVGWLEYDKCKTAFGYDGDKATIVEAVWHLTVSEWDKLLDDTAHGSHITWTQLSDIKALYSAQGRGNLAPKFDTGKDKLKKEVATLRKKVNNNGGNSSAPRLQRLAPGQKACSAQICNFAHGDAKCPFLDDTCKVCTLKYNSNHKAYGRCTNVEHMATEITIDGKTYPRIKVQTGKGGGSNKSTPNHVRRTVRQQANDQDQVTDGSKTNMENFIDNSSDNTSSKTPPPTQPSSSQHMSHNTCTHQDHAHLHILKPEAQVSTPGMPIHDTMGHRLEDVSANVQQQKDLPAGDSETMNEAQNTVSSENVLSTTLVTDMASGICTPENASATISDLPDGSDPEVPRVIILDSDSENDPEDHISKTRVHQSKGVERRDLGSQSIHVRTVTLERTPTTHTESSESVGGHRQCLTAESDESESESEDSEHDNEHLLDQEHSNIGKQSDEYESENSEHDNEHLLDKEDHVNIGKQSDESEPENSEHDNEHLLEQQAHCNIGSTNKISSLHGHGDSSSTSDHCENTTDDSNNGNGDETQHKGLEGHGTGGNHKEVGCCHHTEQNGRQCCDSMCDSCDPVLKFSDIRDIYNIQSDNAQANMWSIKSSVPNNNFCHPVKQQYKTGVLKFYTTTRGRNKSLPAETPWGFITPSEPGRDIHFTMYALDDVPESALTKNLMVEYTVMPGSNTAENVRILQFGGRRSSNISQKQRATVDSGAYIHATSKVEYLQNYRPLDTLIPVGTASAGDTIFLHGIGDLHVRAGEQVTVFKNVFYAPKCASTLLSVRLLTKFSGWSLRADGHSTVLQNNSSGKSIHLDDNFQFQYSHIARNKGHKQRNGIKKKHGKVISRKEVSQRPGMSFAAPADNRVEDPHVKYLNTLNAHSTDLHILHDDKRPLLAYLNNGLMEFRPLEPRHDNSYCKWHRRLGHVHSNFVKKFAAVNGITLQGSTPDMVCETCMLSKLVQSISRNKRPRATNFLDTVHSDLIGPFKPLGANQEQYALVNCDCATRSTYVYFQSDKTAESTRKSMEAFCTEVEGRPKMLQVDGGSEYQGQVEAWCAEHNIKIRRSPPYAHYLNGVIERKVRTLKEMTRCLLSDSHLPHTYWPYAMSTAEHIMNIVPTTALPEWQSSYTMRTGKKSDPQQLKTFGCKVIYRKGAPRQDTEDTVSEALADKSLEGIFLGYPKGYPSGTFRILDTSTLKVVTSNQLQFFEQQNITSTKAANVFSASETQEFAVDPDYVPSVEEQEYYDKLDQNDPTEDPTDGPASRLTRQRRQTQRYDPAAEAAKPQWQFPSLSSLSHLFLVNGVLKGSDIVPTLPKSDAAAINDPVFGEEWRAAKHKELAQFERFKAYTEVDRDDVPIGAQILPSHFIRSIKSNGTFKYRLVVAGNFQLGDSAYSPTAAFTSMRMIIAHATYMGYRLRQADVSAAYLQSPIDDEVYVYPPKDLQPSDSKSRNVWRLNKAVYGLRKSPQYWYRTVTAAMSAFGFKASDSDPCVFIGTDIIVGIWVDDFIYGGTPAAIARFESQLLEKFVCDPPEDASLFCGITIDQAVLPDGRRTVTIRQDAYVERLMEQFDIPVRQVSSPITEYLEPMDTPRIDEDIPYRQLLGALMFVMIGTRPDMAFAVHHLSRFGQGYTHDHYAALVRAMQYVHSTRHRQITYTQTSRPIIAAYSDASWAGCPFTRKSTSGRLVYYGGSLVSWCSQLQRAVATSSCESELYALTDTVKEVLYLRLLLEDFTTTKLRPSPIFCDNEGTIQICSGRDQHLKRVRHIRSLKRFLDIRRRFIMGQSKDVEILHCKTDKMLADLLTKPLGRLKGNSLASRVFAPHPLSGGQPTNTDQP